jgi:hypothetical protein
VARERGDGAVTPAARDRVELLSTRLAYATAVAIVLCLLGPILVLTVTSLILGITTGEQPQNGGLAWSEDFPPFDPQLWLMWIPIALIAFWIGVTIPVPLKRAKGLGRLTQFLFLFVIFWLSITLIAGFYPAPWIGKWGTQWAPTTILVIGAVLLLRIVLGAVRALPRSWRMYLDADGNPEPPRPRGPSPLSRMPQ